MALWLSQEIAIPSKVVSLETIPVVPSTIWWIDNFGNCKTTLIKDDLQKESIQTQWGTLPLYAQLRDVSDGIDACVVGSSGLESQRFIELGTQGESFANKHCVNTGKTFTLL